MVGQLVATAVTFVVALFFLPMAFGDMRVRGSSRILVAGAAGGIVSAVGSRLLYAALVLIFFPIVLLGPLGPWVVQAGVNLVLLVVGWRLFDEIEFKRWSTVGWASLALTGFQFLVTLVGGTSSFQ